MKTIQLQRNVQFLYEEHLARLEFEALGCRNIARDGDRWNQMTADVNGSSEPMLGRSAYLGRLDDRPSVYGTLNTPQYQGGRFNRTRSVNQYLTHWIYPYQGKFHPQMIRGLLNLLGAKPGDLVCEPFLGSGTTAVEASLLGMNCVGVDLSPLCVLLTKVKTESWRAAETIRKAVGRLIAEPNLSATEVAGRTFRDARVRDFVTIARLVTASDVARRGRDADVAFRKNLLAMCESVEAHAQAIREFGIAAGRVDASIGDSRNLRAAGIEDETVDLSVTSPPYSIALDYVKNDEHALDVLGVSTAELRATMTGVRGKGPKQKLALYNADMQAMFREVARVLKPGAPAAFVIGDATVDGSEVTTTDDMARWAADSGLALERRIPKIVFGLYSVMKDEQILVFRKE
jgi:hypothetical protein